MGAIRKGFQKVSSVSAKKTFVNKQKTVDYELNTIEDFPIYEKNQQKAADLVNAAIDANEDENFELSARLLERAYSYGGSISENLDYLYYAASSHVNAENFTKALGAYLFLLRNQYTGVVEKFFITEKKSKKKAEVTETEYYTYRDSNRIIDSRIELTESKLPDIVRNVALIYAQLGDIEKALEFTTYARSTNPDDMNLILTEANIYIELVEKEKFKSLMNEAIAQDPNNANLYYNLAVVTSDSGDKESARKYYEKAIDIDPTYTNAYLNLVALILEKEQVIVETMNNLGTSAADNIKYDNLKFERENLYRETIPYLKSLISVSRNQNAIKTLLNIYGTLEMKKEYKALQKKYF